MKIDKVIERQFRFQDDMKSNWGVMFLALIEEFGEFVASTGYADWKKVPRDEENMNIELIDIAIFSINLLYYECLPYEREPCFVDTIDEVSFIRNLSELIGKNSWSDIITVVFEYKPELLDILIAKQALNQLRQDYGYKENEYIKDWNGKEDNTYLAQFYGNSYDTVYLSMETIYTDKIIASRLVDV